jgi:membrane-associated phospholipid phosphatase
MASVALLSVVIALRAYLQWIGPIPGDRYAAARFGRSWSEPAVLRPFISFFTELGSPSVAVALICLGLVVVWSSADWVAARGLVVACLVLPLNALLKLVSGPTPLWSDTYHVGLNFPSGHVAFVTAVVGYLGWVAARRQQVAGVAVALVVIIGMGPARVVAGAHLVSDVIAGYLVGGVVLVLAAATSRVDPSVAIGS